ncbi:hypothetical protein EMCG_05870 [[Emmonsia] crescens]|uniref:Uncharacterized protein n=1 Tax=[Emmonsia] crescens TaxID=73230 RepID=A0A0G2ID34_9EURO|nr:hypothetical protein EMCG_05870 [Emmonsia crescens UAMH 3008]
MPVMLDISMKLIEKLLKQSLILTLNFKNVGISIHAFRDSDAQYLKMEQREAQSVHQFVTQLQAVEGRLRHSYEDYHRKSHLYMKVLPEIRREFDKYAVKLEDLDYDAVLTRLATAENNLPERKKKIKEKFNFNNNNFFNRNSNNKDNANCASTSNKKRKWDNSNQCGSKESRKWVISIMLP